MMPSILILESYSLLNNYFKAILSILEIGSSK